ncbi:hypothetical protein AMS68_001880 [Peltaster fructicola]|uniref:DNA repair and recombination protein RAD54B n=1 Tax=Peltaster fructicola TaxID=286661 RepID=A0A6H0XNR7_9PEZI|nr:hypothetical protein AMS68_001880 [Peltaster fructicola]
MKPFKPPTVVGRQPLPSLTVSDLPQVPGQKRKAHDAAKHTAFKKAKTQAAIQKQSGTKHDIAGRTGRPPLSEVPAGQSNQSPPTTEQDGDEVYYSVLWRKFTTKKNKIWDGDGILGVANGVATLQDVSGRHLGKGSCKMELLEGSTLSLAGREIEIASIMLRTEVLGGRRFLNNNKQENTSAPVQRQPAPVRNDLAALSLSKSRAPVSSHARSTEYKMPLLKNNVLTSTSTKLPTPRHDPNAPGALVMARPKDVKKGKQIVDVVVDPILTKHLREHQRQGVSFLYECVMGMKAYPGEGAILADEMGLGKTLQTIALLWTLLKQNPISDEQPIIKKALIVCPVTLIKNWRKEFRKWLGNERIGVLVADEKKTRLTDFTLGKTYSVMIIGYERLRSVKEDLQKGSGIDIVIADEGHRLKTAKNKSADAIKSLSTERRIILSGTPIQNDLEEFYTMVDFVNPNLLNKYSVFKREFEVPILKSQQPGATKKELEKGEARSEELAAITNLFILRRTAEILSKYLPTKTEYVLFCKPTNVQAKVYRAIIGSPIFASAIGGSSVSLELINVLKKVCNSPNLLLSKGAKEEEATRMELFDNVPMHLLKSPAASGKLQVLDSLLHTIRTTTEEKVVLVSNYTSTLDILGNLLTSLSYPFLRLDGSTAVHKRQELVDRFNRTSANNFFVFLLSAKAGGMGINLVGASRLILYDLDWNPATDLQAMARIHRDGQKRPCYIYRMLTAGALDEKIFQRQVSKTGLADSIVDGKSSASGFTREELRDLFTLDESQDCQTHKLLGCKCGGTGTPLATTTSDVIAIRDDLVALEAEASDAVQASSNPAVLEAQVEGEVETVHLEDQPDSAWRGAFTSSAHVDMNAQEEELQRMSKECKDSEGRDKMLSLMQYTHLDPSQVHVEAEDTALDPLEGLIEDAALRNVLREDGRRVNFVLTKVSS